MKTILIAMIFALSASLGVGQITWTSTNAGSWSNSGNWSASGGTPSDSYPGETSSSRSDVININHDMDYDLTNGYPTYASAVEFNGTVNVNSSFTITSGSQMYVEGSASLVYASGQTVTVDGGIFVVDDIGSLSNFGVAGTNSGILALTGNLTPTANFTFSSGARMEIMGESPGGFIFFGFGSSMTFNTGTAWTEDNSFSGTLFNQFSPTFEEGSSFYQSTSTAYNWFGGFPIMRTGFSGGAGWRHMSCPLVSTFSGAGLPHVTTDNGAANIYQWDASENASDTAVGWSRITSAGQNFGGSNPAAIVYVTPSISGDYQPSGTVQVTGTPFISNQAFTLYNYHDPLGDGSSSDQGWNFLPNPYPCNLDLQAVSDGFNLGYKGIHVWDVSASQYKVYLNGATQVTHSNSSASSTSAQYIRPWQGFWVKMQSGTSTSKTITTSMRSNDVSAADYFKTSMASPSMFRLWVNSADQNVEGSDEALVYFKNETSQFFEPQFDAMKKFTTVYGVPSLYFEKDNGNNEVVPLAINSSLSASQNAIPVYFRNDIAGTYTLTYQEENEFKKEVILIDHKNGTEKRLEGQDITFDYDPTDDNHRFTLVFNQLSDQEDPSMAGVDLGSGTTNIVELEASNDVLKNCFVQGNDLILALNLVETTGNDYVVEIVELSGKTLFSAQFNGSSNISIPAPELNNSNLILVQISSVDGTKVESRKVVLK